MLRQAHGHIDRIAANGRDRCRGIEVNVDAGVAHSGNVGNECVVAHALQKSLGDKCHLMRARAAPTAFESALTLARLSKYLRPVNERVQPVLFGGAVDARCTSSVAST